MKLQKLVLKKLMKPLLINLFPASFKPLGKHCAAQVVARVAHSAAAKVGHGCLYTADLCSAVSSAD
jgi:hypothetical protein